MSQGNPEKSYYDRAFAMREKLAAVSSCFCVAKFKLVSLHLQTGFVHSCQHPTPHKIPLAELVVPSALANTKHLIEQRRLMRTGTRPKECDYCWRIEDSGSKLSDRHFKSAEKWAEDSFAEASQSAPDKHFTPDYLEVSFTNKCNMSCSYCSPESSSAWLQEIKKFGPMELANGEKHLAQFTGLHPAVEFHDEDKNPYIEAFWKWWPELYPKLKVFRITGGEPLLSHNTYRVLDWIAKNPRPDLQLAINTNLAVPPVVLQRFLEAVEPLAKSQAFKRFTVFTSIDTFGGPAEYARHGLDSEKWLSNVHQVLQRLPGIYFTTMCTFNALSISNFEELLKHQLELRNRFAPEQGDRIVLDIGYLRWPEHQSLLALDSEQLLRLRMLETRMLEMHEVALQSGLGFDPVELEKMRRMTEWALSPMAPDKKTRLQKNFYLFFSELDRRRGTDFVKTFPEMRNFWRKCKALVDGASVLSPSP